MRGHIYKLGSIYSAFFLPLFMKDIKNIKISTEVHSTLKEYCEENGLKMYKFLEKMIIDKCTKPKDIYGE